MVYLVLMLASGAIWLQPGRGLMRRSIAAPFTAAGRKLVTSTAEQMLAEHALTTGPPVVMMAGAFAQRAPVEYVMVALTDEPVAGDGYAVGCSVMWVPSICVQRSMER